MVFAAAVAAAVLAAPLQVSTAPLFHPESRRIERPRDIWVFRSVLDRNPRMLTAALSPDIWVAYDTRDMSLYKVWNGGVKFDGAVYTTVHGPQPTTQGSPYLQSDPASPAWSIVAPDGSETPANPRYLGYQIQSGSLVIRSEILAAGRRVLLEESPEAVPSQGDVATIGLRRLFRATNLPAGHLLRWRGTFAQAPRSITGRSDSENALALTTMPRISFSIAGGDSQLVKAWNRPGQATVGQAQPPAIPPEAPDELPADAAAEVSALSGKARQTGPSSTQDVAAQRVPGLSLRLYHVGTTLLQIPRLVEGQTPNFSVVVPRLALENNSFGPYTDQFVVHITGFINAPVAGTYRFRLASDDGSRLFIGDNLVIDHDGLHSAESGKPGSTELVKGENRLFIEMFENEGDAALWLEWMPPGAAQWEVVPASAFTTPAGEVRVTAPGKKAIVDRSSNRPGDRVPLEDVHPSYTLTTIRPDSFQPRVGGMDFLPDGRLVVCTWDAEGAVYVLSNLDGPRDQIQVKRIAVGLAEPLGLKVVDGDIYVLQKQELTRLVDHDGDGVTDEYQAVSNGWGVTDNFHEFAFGLEFRNGKFYGNLATAIDPGGSSTQPQNPDRGKTFQIDPRTGRYRFILDGLRTPNGIGYGAFGHLYMSDNQGDWLPVSKIALVREGAFYGNRSVDPVGHRDTPEDPPVVWLPQNEIGNSPSQITPLPHGPYRGQMVHGDVTHGGLKRVFVERVSGVYQGAVFRFTQGLEGGVNRVIVGPDGAFYIGGIGSSGNWGQAGKASYGLQRLAFNGRPTFEMLTVSPRLNGVEIRFTQPLALGHGETPADYRLEQWRYVPTVAYGGPKVDEETLTVKSVTVSRDRRTVFLEAEGLQEGRVFYVRLHTSLRSQSGQPVWSTEAWYTLNKLPNRSGRVAPARPTLPAAAPTQDETREGFVALFDGTGLSNFVGWRQSAVPAGWTVGPDSSLLFTPGSGGGDLRTRQTFRDFELRFQWKISPGGNSGVMVRATEERNQSYESGVEYQILDNGPMTNPKQSAAAVYDLYAPSFDVTRPVGHWNEGRIIARGTQVQHWLNGHLVAQYDTASQEFKDLVAASKFATWPSFAKPQEGFIVFQDHGNVVSYRNIRVRRL